MALMTSVGLLILRLALALIFLGHGAQKLFGLFGGPGLEGTRQLMRHLGVRPAAWWGTILAVTECLAGLLIALGLLTPIGAALIVMVMAVAIAKVHWRKGFWNSQGGYEFNLILAALALVLGIMGAGTFSVDAVLASVFGVRLADAPTFLVAVIVVAAVYLVMTVLGGMLEERRETGSLLPRHARRGHPSHA